MNEHWRAWPETKRLQEGLRLLLSRNNGRRMAMLLGDEVERLLDYKANRKGFWRAKPNECMESWRSITGDK